MTIPADKTRQSADQVGDDPRRHAWLCLGLLLVAYALRQFIIYAASIVTGVFFWMMLGLFAIAMLLAARHGLIWLSARLSRPRRWDGLVNACVVVGTISLSCVVIELYLAFAVAQDRSVAEAAASDGTAPSRAVVTGDARIVLSPSIVARMNRLQSARYWPKEWDGQRVSVPGAADAFRYFDVLHAHDENGFRRNMGQFPERRDGVARIVILGDSQTFGYGVDADWAYPTLVEQLLSHRYRVEVFNLGVIAYQSEDVARVLDRFIGPLKPDLVIYGICLNDFLPSGKLERDFNAPPLPLPAWIAEIAAYRTHLGRFLEDSYQPLLIRLGIRNDFYDDALKNIAIYRPRFTDDLRRMQNAARAAGIAPVIGMVIDPQPRRNGRGQVLARIAEESMRAADFDIIPTEDYYRIHDGQSFSLSQWDGHPNEAGQAVAATMIVDHLIRRDLLQAYERPAAR